MSYTRINYSPKLTKYFLDSAENPFDQFLLLDIGASGGIDEFWRILEPNLKAIGFDPLVAEVERLNKKEKNKNIFYEDAYIVYKDLDRVFPPNLRNNRLKSKNNQPFSRTSASLAAQVMNLDYTHDIFNAGLPVRFSDRFIQIDDYVTEKGLGEVDFIKIDTDGHDFPVLLGAESTLINKNVLGLSVEVLFHGPSHPYGNTFSNIDNFLRSLGFTLFGLDVYHYTKKALPGIFVYNIPAQTHGGQIQWGEAVYFRDLANENYEEMFGYEISKYKLSKLACLFELFGFPDCAAELILARGNNFNLDKQPNFYLDLLTPLFKLKKLDYQSYIDKFISDPSNFYDKKKLIKQKFKHRIKFIPVFGPLSVRMYRRFFR